MTIDGDAFVVIDSDGTLTVIMAKHRNAICR